MMPKVRQLTPALQKIAIEELHEDPDDIPRQIEAVRQWTKEQSELGKYNLSDQFILNFLRSCKYNHETLHRKLPKYLTMRLICPEIFANRKVTEDMMDLIRAEIHLPLSVPMETDLSRIHISQYGKLDVKNYSLYQGLKIHYMMLEINLLEDDHTAVAGYTKIEDLAGVTFSHMIAINLMVLKRIIDFTRCGLPHRIKGIHVVNAPWFTIGLLSICRNLLPAKMKSRFFIHRRFEDLYQHVNQKLLPAEYGGENETTEDIIKAWERKIEKYEEYFDHDLQFGTGHEDEE